METKAALTLDIPTWERGGETVGMKLKFFIGEEGHLCVDVTEAGSDEGLTISLSKPHVDRIIQVAMLMLPYVTNHDED